VKIDEAAEYEEREVSAKGENLWSFKSLFCERFNCSPQNYQSLAFRRFLPWHAKTVAVLVRRLHPEFFARDFAFIGALGESRDMMEVIEVALEFRDANSTKRRVCSWLRIGISERKAVRLAQRCFEQFTKPRWTLGVRLTNSGKRP